MKKPTIDYNAASRFENQMKRYFYNFIKNSTTDMNISIIDMIEYSKKYKYDKTRMSEDDFKKNHLLSIIEDIDLNAINTCETIPNSFLFENTEEIQYRIEENKKFNWFIIELKREKRRKYLDIINEKNINIDEAEQFETLLYQNPDIGYRNENYDNLIDLMSEIEMFENEDINFKAAFKYENDKSNAIIKYIKSKSDEPFSFNNNKYPHGIVEYNKKLEYEKSIFTDEEIQLYDKLYALNQLDFECIKKLYKTGKTSSEFEKIIGSNFIIRREIKWTDMDPNGILNILQKVRD